MVCIAMSAVLSETIWLYSTTNVMKILEWCTGSASLAAKLAKSLRSYTLPPLSQETIKHLRNPFCYDHVSCLTIPECLLALVDVHPSSVQEKGMCYFFLELSRNLYWNLYWEIYWEISRNLSRSLLRKLSRSLLSQIIIHRWCSQTVLSPLLYSRNNAQWYRHWVFGLLCKNARHPSLFAILLSEIDECATFNIRLFLYWSMILSLSLFVCTANEYSNVYLKRSVSRSDINTASRSIGSISFI